MFKSKKNSYSEGGGVFKKSAFIWRTPFSKEERSSQNSAGAERQEESRNLQ